ncbi:hypothetical protein CKAN_00011600 [Cinnamomum micranthum f. kanehirae]|uniref:Uncharacterized protein n=1 Tax=Cinnamomum micranthum f. kanehirae TaxID=337451 RepID=A0A3S3M8M3_9MAGN|nr:hypothetical protein CKAN_00011600 [Cinnamomum micranthum f. kanehirae]
MDEGKAINLSLSQLLVTNSKLTQILRDSLFPISVIPIIISKKIEKLEDGKNPDWRTKCYTYRTPKLQLMDLKSSLLYLAAKREPQCITTTRLSIGFRIFLEVKRWKMEAIPL